MRKLLFHQKFVVTKVWKSWLRNRKLPLQFPYCENGTTGIEKRLRNYNFQRSVTGISNEMDISFELLSQQS